VKTSSLVDKYESFRGTAPKNSVDIRKGKIGNAALALSFHARLPMMEAGLPAQCWYVPAYRTARRSLGSYCRQTLKFYGTDYTRTFFRLAVFERIGKRINACEITCSTMTVSFISFFLSPTSFYLLIVGLEGYCYT
jgi:hypothetical protein